MCVLLSETYQEEISVHKEEVLPFWCGSVQSALASESTLSCQETVKRDVGGMQMPSRGLLRTQSFTLWVCVAWMSFLRLILKRFREPDFS